ncbi:MAG: tryptophan 2,3-dioxygenase, partial [Bacteroidia bacterium]|nr:tryptophan 2,3-dioxygenase [Bacteroidia bacterium]
MKKQPETEKLLEQLKVKYDAIGQDLDTQLEGLLYGEPITYWDYIQTDALLNLQIQRTTLPDEMVFIIYHQINELLFKMVLWEIEQITHHENLTAKFFSERLMRISRYFDMLTSSFNIMSEGMEIEQYLKFRNTLTPASGFQSAQYRMIEFASTDLINLIDARFRDTIDRNTPYEHALEHLYWQAAGKDYKTGKKSYLLKAFEERYKNRFIAFTKE